MKKTLALVLALAMVFSTITVAFAEGTLSADAQICADLGMLKGSTGTVDAAYTATAPTRIQAAVMFLRLKGLEAEATAFTGAANFADADKAAWAKPIMAYLKANPQLGWQGDGTNFDPTGVTTAQAYYKVMLEALGYKQTTPEVVGDFAYADVMTFAASKGLTKVATVANFTVNDLAVATVEALKANMKDGGKTLVATLAEAGKVDKAKAVAAGLIVEAPAAPAVAVDEAEALGNSVVRVEYEGDVDAAAAGNVANYSIEGLEIKAVTVTGADTVILDTAAQTVGKLYKLAVGEKTVAFTGIAKVSGGPEITDVVSEDVEEVVITFSKNIDFATGTNVANYSINGITIKAAEVDENEVTLTTEGLKNKTSYIVKVTNVKSIDGVARKTSSEDFKSNFDVQAPKIDAIPTVETNQRIIVTFNEEVDEASAENLANYSIKVNDTDGAELEIVSITWDEDDEDNVEIVTEAMENREEYKISVNNVADQRKVPNVMTRPSTKIFDGVDEDTDAPDIANNAVQVLSPTSFRLTITDDSRIDEASVLDPSNYSLECDDEDLAIEDIVTLKNETGVFVALFTVEEMTDDNASLTYVDILDEFGNAMEEDDVAVNATVASFASAKLEQALVVGENTIFLIFDKALVEATAETLANYSVDEGIGTPIEAEYDDEIIVKDGKYVVILTVNDLVNGKTYDIGVNGVTDLAGNSLKIVDFDSKGFNYDDLAGTTWQTIVQGYDVNDTDTLEDYLADEDYEENWDDELELQDAEAASMYVAALSFDEEIDGDVVLGTATLELTSSDAVYTEASPLVLTAMALSDDDTVVEFSDYAGSYTFDNDVTYTVYKVNNVVDLSGWGVDDWSGAMTFKGTDADPEYAEFDSYEQVDGATFEITMSRWVYFAATGDATGTQVVTADKVVGTTHTSVNFVATIDEDVITLRPQAALTYIVEDADYVFNLYADFTDEHGIPVVDDDDVVFTASIPTAGVTEMTGEDDDEDNPYVTDVFARNRTKVRIEFSENIKAVDANDIEVWNVDLNEELDFTLVAAEATDNDTMVDLLLSDALEGRYQYEVRFEDGAVTDFVDLDLEEDTFSFDGTDLSQN